jgi:hypothetical protein
MFKLQKFFLPALNKNKVAFSLSKVFSKYECNNLIKYGERTGYIQALVNQGVLVPEKKIITYS